MLVTQDPKGVLIGLEVREFDRRRAEWQVFSRCKKKVILAKNGVTRFRLGNDVNMHICDV